MINQLCIRTLIITATVLCCFFQAAVAQKVYEGQVVDKTTEAPVPATTVRLIKQKITNKTDDQGYFKLVVDSAITNDTLIFTSVGYKPYLLPVSAYQRNIFIPLVQLSTNLDQVIIKGDKLKVLTLDKFSYADIKDLYTGGKLFYRTFAYSTFGTYAKLFEAPVPNALITGIDLGRRDFDIPNNLTDYPRTTSNKFAKFLIHVMTEDSITGKPKKKIFTREITLTDNALKVTIDLKNDKIVLPSTKFFIAIEWLRITLNEVITLDGVEKVEKVRKNGSQILQDESQYIIKYQPCIVGFPGKKQTQGWVTLDNINWQPETIYNSLAVSATLTY